MIYALPDRYELQSRVVSDHREHSRRHPTPVVPSNVYVPARSSLPSPPWSTLETTSHRHYERQKVFSFVCLPGTTQQKRPRRKFHEIERLYHCSFSGCNKSYGTLNHLNAHISMKQHGSKRHPSEFKELRKQWRKQKSEQVAAVAQEQPQAMVAHDVIPMMSAPGHPDTLY
ncbi:hypothetical protein BX666DRAFT_1855034 [Dichotomocladium elegans]|nr:hypothetical protein BX666DRAFT_1855034 [Dichotomocladium elegans]